MPITGPDPHYRIVTYRPRPHDVGFYFWSGTRRGWTSSSCYTHYYNTREDAEAAATRNSVDPGTDLWGVASIQEVNLY